VREEQLAIRVQLEGERTKVAADSARARLPPSRPKLPTESALSTEKEPVWMRCMFAPASMAFLQLVPVEVGSM